QAALDMRGPTCELISGETDLRSETLQQLAERLGGGPDARRAGVDVYEQSQDPVSIGWPAGKGVDVDEIVSGFLPQLAGRLFEGTKAHLVQTPACRIVRQHGREPGRRRAREVGQHAPQALGLLDRVMGEAGGLPG